MAAKKQRAKGVVIGSEEARASLGGRSDSRMRPDQMGDNVYGIVSASADKVIEHYIPQGKGKPKKLILCGVHENGDDEAITKFSARFGSRDHCLICAGVKELWGDYKNAKDEGDMFLAETLKRIATDAGASVNFVVPVVKPSIVDVGRINGKKKIKPSFTPDDLTALEYLWLSAAAFKHLLDAIEGAGRGPEDVPGMVVNFVRQKRSEQDRYPSVQVVEIIEGASIPAPALKKLKPVSIWDTSDMAKYSEALATETWNHFTENVLPGLISGAADGDDGDEKPARKKASKKEASKR